MATSAGKGVGHKLQVSFFVVEEIILLLWLDPYNRSEPPPFFFWRVVVVGGGGGDGLEIELSLVFEQKCSYRAISNTCFLSS